MKREVIVSSTVAALVSAVVTAAGFAIALPAIVDAQVSQIIGTGVTVVGSNGKPAIELQQRPPNASPPSSLGGQISALDGNGAALVQIAAGGILPGQVCPGDPCVGAGAGVNVLYPDGTIMARMGTYNAHNGHPNFRLEDRSGKDRLLAELDDNGNASIQILDASGNVVWSAP